MYSLYLECAEPDAEILSAELWARGAAGIQEEPLPGARCLLRAFFDEPGGLLEHFAAFGPRLELEPETDWEAVCRQAWQPMAVGRRLYLAPEWDTSATPAGRIRLIIHPGQALGSGAHPATQLCLEAMERYLCGGDSMLDVGTGSGLLAAAAALLGARRVVGCDIDFDALRSARANLESGSLAALLFAGSVRAVRAGAFDAVAANINAATHESLAAEYARIRPRTLILSGIAGPQVSWVLGTLLPRGFALQAALEREEWRCLVLCNAGPS